MPSMIKIGGKMTIGTTDSAYRNLLLNFLPRPIASEQAYLATQDEIDRLVDKVELTPDEQDYLTLLGGLIEAYEEQVEDETDYELYGVELVKGLLDLFDLKQKDLLPIFKTKSIVSDVLNGKRQLTVEHINKLAIRFNLPHSLFFEPL